MNRLRRVGARADEGQLALLVLAYTLIAALLVTVVVNLSKAFLYRRSLVAAVDGAALAAANQPDLKRVYTGSGRVLPLSDEGVDEAVDQYVADARLADRFDGFRVLSVETDGETVTVRFGAAVRMPFVHLLTPGQRGGYELDATANARSPLTQ